ncbi:serine/arginine repetitive matrix protein 2-like [Gossypium australe]|uniref:Serine/arginine repetitive matrix protein 2-like n=1 Tax=Gossypium australe TaxID=47621 RepID=A0A5B6WH18_9ROSI|nr:serine/arginine repetitive matrix protein 2-like [Gossypium australe]
MFTFWHKSRKDWRLYQAAYFHWGEGVLVSKEDSKVSVNDGQESKRKRFLNFGNAEGLSPNKRSDAEEANKLERASELEDHSISPKPK